jgi:hypothetical protein
VNASAKPKRESLALNLICNIAFPLIILSKLGGDQAWEPFGIVSIPGFGPLGGLLVALAFPLGYGLYDLAKRKKWNLFSIIGLTSVLLSGGIGLMKLDPFWFAVKEAAIPLAIGSIVVGSMWTRRPLVRVFLLNAELVDTGKLEGAIAEKGCKAEFEALLKRATLNLGGLFLLSAVLNFVVARLIVKSPPQTQAFNEELAAMTLWSLVIITVPMMIGMVWALLEMFKGIRRMTGLAIEDLMRKD